MITDKNFEIDFKKLCVLWLPTFLRGAFWRSLCYVLTYPLELMYRDFLKQRKINLEKLEYNYQVFSMEKLLNNKFDPIQRRIFIGSVEIVKGIFSFTKAECVIDPEKILWLDKTKPIFLGGSNNINGDANFIINVPADLIYNIYEFQYQVDFHKLATKNYKIVTF